MNRRLLAAALWLAAAAAGFAQSTTAPATPAPAAPPQKVPEEYQEEEFGPAARALRRGEIVLFGSIPLTLFVSYEVYDIYRFFANDRLPQYAPWPARRPDAVPYRDWETTGVLVAAVSVSLLMAVADHLIGRARGRRAEKP